MGVSITLPSFHQQKNFKPEGVVCTIQVDKKQGPTPRLLFLVRLSFKMEGEIRSFCDKKKLKEFVTSKPVLQQTLRGLL